VAPSCPRQFAAVPEPRARVLGVATVLFTACSKGRDRDLRLPEPAEPVPSGNHGWEF
jgi:hypothetical protein